MHAVSPAIQVSILRDREAAEPFRTLTFPAHRHLLDFADANTIAVGVDAHGLAAGLALAEPDPQHERGAKLVSVFVAPHLRNRGLGRTLLACVEAECAARGMVALRGSYMTGQATEAIEKMLARAGWSAPEPRTVVVRCTLESVRGAPWLHRYPKPAEWEIVPWVGINEAERSEILTSHQREPWIVGDLDPFSFERGIEPTTSLALRVRGKVLGWCLTHLVGDVLRFTCTFVRRDLQEAGGTLMLFSAAMDRLPIIGISTGMWAVPVWHKHMVRFARRRMKPYSVFFGETRGSSKKLQPMPSLHAT